MSYAAELAPFPQSKVLKLRNGTWSDTPIQLSVFGLSKFHRNTAIEQVTRRLENLMPGATTHDDLRVSACNTSNTGFVKFARVSWKPRAWYRDTNLVAEMDRVRRLMNSCDLDLTACWSTSAGDDRRTVGQFKLEQSFSTVTITAAQATASVEKFCEENGHKLLRVTAFSFGKDRA